MIAIVSLIIELLIIVAFYYKMGDQIVSHFHSNYIPDDFREKNFIFTLWAIHIPIWVGMIIILYTLENPKFSYLPKIHLYLACYLGIFNIFSTCKSIFFGINPNYQSGWVFTYIEFAIVAVFAILGIVSWRHVASTGTTHKI